MKFLMCPPKHFRVDYEINVWMRKHRSVNKSEVQKQYETLKNIYQNLGIEVLEIEQHPDLPDMVYAANYGFVYKNIFVRANFKHEERKKEAELAAEYMGNLGYEVRTLPEGLTFEGQGDLFYCEGKFYSGYGFRTKIETIKELEKIFEQEVVALKLVDPRWYHCDTCFLPLGQKRVMIAPEAFDKESLEKIHSEFDEVIECTHDDDIQNFSCNSIVIGNNVITNRMTEELKTLLQNKGYKIIEAPTSEFLKGGGSVRCLTLDMPQ